MWKLDDDPRAGVSGVVQEEKGICVLLSGKGVAIASVGTSYRACQQVFVRSCIPCHAETHLQIHNAM